MSDAELLLGLSVTNTTPQPGLTDAGITSVGFGIDPDATSVAFQNGTTRTSFDSAAFGVVPGFKGVVEICAFTANNCQGGGQGNLLAIGDTDSFVLSILGNFSDEQGGQAVTLNSFATKTQTNVGSFELPGGNGTHPTQTTPEPGTLFLMGSGLAGLGLWRWKTKK